VRGVGTRHGVSRLMVLSARHGNAAGSFSAVIIKDSKVLLEIKGCVCVLRLAWMRHGTYLNLKRCLLLPGKCAEHLSGWRYDSKSLRRQPQLVDACIHKL